MPGNGFSFTVRVCCQINLFSFPGECLDLLDHCPLFIRDPIFGCKIVVHIHRQFGAQKITHVTHRCPHSVTLAQESSHRFRLGRASTITSLPLRSFRFHSSSNGFWQPMAPCLALPGWRARRSSPVCTSLSRIPGISHVYRPHHWPCIPVGDLSFLFWSYISCNKLPTYAPFTGKKSTHDLLDNEPVLSPAGFHAADKPKQHHLYQQ